MASDPWAADPDDPDGGGDTGSGESGSEGTDSESSDIGGDAAEGGEAESNDHDDFGHEWDGPSDHDSDDGNDDADAEPPEPESEADSFADADDAGVEGVTATESVNEHGSGPDVSPVSADHYGTTDGDSGAAEDKSWFAEVIEAIFGRPDDNLDEAREAAEEFSRNPTAENHQRVLDALGASTDASLSLTTLSDANGETWALDVIDGSTITSFSGSVDRTGNAREKDSLTVQIDASRGTAEAFRGGAKLTGPEADAAIRATVDRAVSRQGGHGADGTPIRGGDLQIVAVGDGHFRAKAAPPRPEKVARAPQIDTPLKHAPEKAPSSKPFEKNDPPEREPRERREQSDTSPAPEARSTSTPQAPQESYEESFNEVRKALAEAGGDPHLAFEIVLQKRRLDPTNLNLRNADHYLHAYTSKLAAQSVMTPFGLGVVGSMVNFAVLTILNTGYTVLKSSDFLRENVVPRTDADIVPTAPSSIEYWMGELGAIGVLPGRPGAEQPSQSP